MVGPVQKTRPPADQSWNRSIGLRNQKDPLHTEGKGGIGLTNARPCGRQYLRFGVAGIALTECSADDSLSDKYTADFEGAGYGPCFTWTLSGFQSRSR